MKENGKALLNLFSLFWVREFAKRALMKVRKSTFFKVFSEVGYWAKICRKRIIEFIL